MAGVSQKPATARPQRSQPIGVFDSGIGGATVLREIARQLPGEDLIYLADQANCPYGPRPAAELRRLTLAGVGWLRARGAKLIVIACNSASAAALHAAREAFPDTPLVGMVPAVKPAAGATRSGVVGVLATPATIGGALLREVIERWAGQSQVITQPCAGLAEAVEAGALGDDATRALVAQYVAPLVAAGADTLVLGCTHYPFLADQIRAAAGPGVALIDPAPAVARQAARLLVERGLRCAARRTSQITYATTGDPARLAELVALLGLPGGRTVACAHAQG